MAMKDKTKDQATHERLAQSNAGTSSDEQTRRKLQTEDALKQAHDNLERLVEERTSELSAKNRQLLEEIEERKRVEGQLRRSEEKYRHIYENIQDIYYEIGIDGIIQELSSSVERITKYTRDELIGTSVYEIYVFPEERPVISLVCRVPLFVVKTWVIEENSVPAELEYRQTAGSLVATERVV